MRIRLALLSILVIATTSCSRTGAAGTLPAHAGWPATFRYNIAVTTEDPSVRAHRLELIRGYLEKELGIPVEITATVNYGGTVEAMRAKKIEAASMGPFAYLLASEKAGAEAIVARGSAKDGSAGDYAGTLCVAADSPLHSIDDVTHHSKELTVSFVDPASASGYLVERAYLDSLGMDPERDFRKIVFSNNHTASALTLLARKVDVAAISENTISQLVLKGRMKATDIRVLWKSPRIPNAPVAVRGDLPADLKLRLQQALVALSTKAPDVWKNMQTVSTASGTTYVAISDSTFDGLRQMARGVKNVKLLESN